MALFHFYEPYFVPSLMITHIIANEGIILALLSPPSFSHAWMPMHHFSPSQMSLSSSLYSIPV